MKTKELLSTVEHLGVLLRIFDGRLEAKNIDRLDKETLQQLKVHEQKILQIMCKQNSKLEIPNFSKPYITVNGELIIPSDCHPKYKYWLRKQESPWTPINKSQSLKETLIELGATDDVMKKYIKSE